VNCLLPQRYYFDNVIGMIEIERMMGFTSSLYFLNGTGGRFGARSGSALISKLAGLTPKGWIFGIHYNYDTFNNEKNFSNQLKELESIIGANVSAGRAHYLRFDPAHSWNFLSKMGVMFDESLGYSDCIGYRAGIAGPFKPFDSQIEREIQLIEMPMVMMDTALITQYGENAVDAFEQHLRHLSIVGGALSLLFHPGYFHNPEYPESLGLYRRLLDKARLYKARSIENNIEGYD
jgi:hypothetical protein